MSDATRKTWNGSAVEHVFALRVRELRGQQRLSQAQLADKLQREFMLTIDPTAITRIERETRSVRLGEAALIASALGVELADLLDPRALSDQLATAEIRVDSAETALEAAKQERDRLRSLATEGGA